MNNLVENTDITIDNIAMDWLYSAIKVLQNNKARGIYLISAGLLKHGEDIIIEKLNEIEIVIWYTGQTLSEWSKGIIVKICKKRHTKLL